MSVSTLETRTQDVQTSVAQCFNDWKKLVADSFVPLETESDHADSFHGRLRSRALDGVCVVEVNSTDHQVRRTPLQLNSSERYFKLSLQLSGTGLLMQGNREAVLSPGDMALYDTDRPYTLAFEDSARSMVVMFPYEAIPLPPDYVKQLSAVRLKAGTGMSAAVGPFIQGLAGNMGMLAGPGGSRLIGNVLDLVTTMLHSELDLAAGDMRPQSLLVTSVREYIEANLGNSDLSPATIAAAHFISTRHLHNLFHETGVTVATSIRLQRLERIRRELRDPLKAGVPITAIASRWGFPDAAHFSRTFRDAYGRSPSVWRREG